MTNSTAKLVRDFDLTIQVEPTTGIRTIGLRLRMHQEIEIATTESPPDGSELYLLSTPQADRLVREVVPLIKELVGSERGGQVRPTKH